MKKRMLIFAMTMALCMIVFSLTAKADDVRLVNSYLSLQSAFVEASRDPNDPTVVTLGKDITTLSPLELSGAYMILDLNGYKIDRGLESATENGFVIRVNGGSLTLIDTTSEKTGAITGGYSDLPGIGSAVDIINGEFNFFDGNIIGNKGSCQVSLHSNSYNINPCFIMNGGLISNGGNQYAVRVDKGTFKMSGGMIADNPRCGIQVNSNGSFEMSGDAKICRNSTGVEVSGGKINMTGGEISGNTFGMTVNTSATYRFSGSPRITGNKSNQDVEQNLVFNHFSSQGVNGLVYISGPLTDNALIGVYIGIHSTEGTPQIFADGIDGYKITNSDLGKFTSDDKDYFIELNSDSKLQLANDPGVIYDLYVAGIRVTDKNADDLSVIYGVTGKANYDPETNTLNLNGATITNSLSKDFRYGIQYIGTKDFTINSKGNNTISASGGLNNEFSAGIEVGSPDKDTEGYKSANMTINIASGSVLTVKSGNPEKSSAPKSMGIAYDYMGTVTIKGSGTLNAVSGKGFIGIGLYSACDIDISGNVTVNAEANGYHFSDGINSGRLFIDGNVKVQASASDADEASCGIYSEIICISGGNVAAAGGKDTDPSDDGYVDPLYYAGINACEMEIKGENTIVSAKSSCASMFSSDKFKICDPLSIFEPQEGVIGSDETDSNRRLVFESDGKTIATDVLIRKFTPTPTKAAASLTLDKKTATVKCGKTLTLKATLKNSTSKVSWKSSDTKTATVDGNGKITAKKAGRVTITATAAGKSAKCTVTVLYKDVTNPEDFWYAPTNYLTAKGVVKGYADQTEFRPANQCTRAQMVTFLYRLQGEPKTKATTCKFDDVKSADYFYKPVIWAVENGITTGVSAKKFAPKKVCTRAQTVTFLWRMAGKPEPAKNAKKFSDVKSTDYFYKATLWASGKKILAGYDDGTFKPQGKCLRRQMVTFLYKYDKYVNGKG